MKIYLVTNRKICNGDYYKKIEEACKSNVDYIILREKDLLTQESLEFFKKIKYITQKHNTPLIINGSLEVSQIINSYGYHSNYETFIKYGKRYKYEGVSIHSIKEGENAWKKGADYILAGHIFKTKCKKGLEPKGIEFLKKLKQIIPIPIVAIGGINHRNIKYIKEIGIERVGVMSYIMSNSNTLESIKKLKGVK